MKKPGVESVAEIVQSIADEPTVASSAVGSLATEMATRVAEQPTIRHEQAATDAFYKQVMPEDASPEAILRGDYGEETQLAFLGGAMMAAEKFIDNRIASTDE